MHFVPYVDATHTFLEHLAWTLDCRAIFQLYTVFNRDLECQLKQVDLLLAGIGYRIFGPRAKKAHH